MSRALATMVVLILGLALLRATSPSASPPRVDGLCPVTIPSRDVPPNAGFTAAGFNHGGRYLRAHLYWPRGRLAAGRLPDGGFMATINPDGSIYVKVGWWRSVRGKLVIAGRRIDTSAPPLRARVPDGYGLRGFQPSGITFPTVGCWRVVGKVGSARLTLRRTGYEGKSLSFTASY